MKTGSIALLGAALALGGCSGNGPLKDPAPSEPTGAAYSCQGGETLKADYQPGGVVVSFRNESWHMAAASQPGKYVLQTRVWQVKTAPGGEEGVLSAVAGGKSAVIAQCSRRGPPSAAAQALLPPGAAPDCTAASLSLKFLNEDAGAGQRYDTFAVSNRGTAACAVQGFARVRLIGDTGAQVPGVTVEQSLTTGPTSGPAQRIELQPGKRAVFYMHWTPIQSGEETCPHVTRLDVTAPGGKSGLIPLDATPCGGHVQISPLRSE